MFAEGEQETFNYVSFGASSTNGYGLHGYLNPKYYKDPITDRGSAIVSCYNNEVKGSWPSLFKAKLEDKFGVNNVNFKQLAQSSMRVEELRFLLDDEFTTDQYTRWRFYNDEEEIGENQRGWFATVNEGGLDGLREDYKNSIENADLITFDLGIANFSIYLIRTLFSDKPEHAFGNDLGHVFGDEIAERFYSIREKIDEEIKKITGDKLDPAEIEKYVDTFAYAILGYDVHFDKCIEKIRELNKDCDIVVVSVQNPFAHLDVSIKGLTIPLGDLFGVAINAANLYAATLSPYVREYKYADVRQNGRCEYFGDQLQQYVTPTTGTDADKIKALDQDIRDCLDIYDTTGDVGFVFKTRLAEALYNSQNPGNIIVIAGSEEIADNITVIQGLSEKYEVQDPDKFNKALFAGYDAVFTALKEILSINPVPLDCLFEDNYDIDANSTKVWQGLLDIGLSAALKSMGIATYIEDNYAEKDITAFDLKTAIEQLLKDNNAKADAVYFVRSLFGNTFFTHPDRVGHQQIAEKVWKEYSRKTTGPVAVLKAVIPSFIKTVKTVKNYYIPIVRTLLKKVINI